MSVCCIVVTETTVSPRDAISTNRNSETVRCIYEYIFITSSLIAPYSFSHLGVPLASITN